MDLTIPIVIGVSVLAGGVVMIPSTYIAVTMYPYLYANTRCGARAGLILKPKFYEELIAASNVKEVYAMLEDTSYADVVEHSKNFTVLSGLLEVDLAKTYGWLVKVVPTAVKPIVKAMALKFEVNEIKAVLNAIKNNTILEELHNVSDVNLKLKLENSKDFASFLTGIEGSPYETIIGNLTLKELSTINTNLDKYYIESIKAEVLKLKDRKAAEPFAEYLSTMVDIINMRLLVRKITMKLDVTFMDKGTFVISQLDAIGDLAQLESLFTEGVYLEYFTDVKNMENMFYKYLRKQAYNLAARFTIKSGSVVKYIILKELEIRNLNILIKLKSENFDAEELQKFVVM